MPVMVVGGCNIGPAAAGEGAKEAPEPNEAGQLGARPAREQVPESDEGEARAGCDCDEELKEGPFRISVANGGRDGGEPLLRVAEPFVLDDLVVVEGDADDEGAQEGS